MQYKVHDGYVKLLENHISRSTDTYSEIKWKVGAQTQVELKDRKLRIEDALNAARVSSAYLWFF